jgi:uncharacterized protein (TIGR02246 family)
MRRHWYSNEMLLVVLITLMVGSSALAWNDPGGSSGRGAPAVNLHTVEEEMQFLHEDAFRAQAESQQAIAEPLHSGYRLTRGHEQVVAASDHTDDGAVIADLLQQYARSYTTGDAEAVAALFTEDAVFIAPDGEVLEGHEEILASFRDHFESSVPLSMDVIEVVVVGDTAYGTIRYAAGPEGDVVVEGYGLSVWSRVDGSWWWHRGVANLIAPEPDEH